MRKSDSARKANTTGQSTPTGRAKKSVLPVGASSLPLIPPPAPVDIGSAYDSGLIATVLSEASRLLGLPLGAEAHLDPRLVEKILQILPTYDRRPGAALIVPGRKPEPPRLAPRARDKAKADPVLYLSENGQPPSATPYRASQLMEANVWLEGRKRLAELKLLGRVLPSQIPVHQVLDHIETVRQPKGNPTKAQMDHWTTLLCHINELRSFFGTALLIDVPALSILYVDHRINMLKRRGDTSAFVSDQTARYELEILQSGLSSFCKANDCGYKPFVFMPKKRKGKVGYLKREELSRLEITAARGWIWNKAKGTWETEIVTYSEKDNWKAECGCYKGKTHKRITIDPVTGRLVTIAVKDGDTYERPVADLGIKDTARAMLRMIIIGIGTGTRITDIRMLRWSSNGDDGTIDFKKGILYRQDVGRETNEIKEHPALELPTRLVRLLKCWAKNDARDETNHVIHKRDGTGYETDLAWFFKKLRNRAGLDEMPNHSEDRRFVEADGTLVELTFHHLRHTLATWMRADGVAIDAAARYLGLTPETLRKTYGHWTVASSMAARDAVNLRLRQFRAKVE